MIDKILARFRYDTLELNYFDAPSHTLYLANLNYIDHCEKRTCVIKIEKIFKATENCPIEREKERGRFFYVLPKQRSFLFVYTFFRVNFVTNYRDIKITSIS